MKTRRILAVILAAIMIFSLAGVCMAEQSEGDVKYREEITIGYDIAIVSLNRFNPGMDGTSYQRSYLLLWDRLTDSTAEGEVIPMLATEWSTEDYKTWNFKLRDDVYFTNGEQLTADDVVYTFEKATEAIGTSTYDNMGRNFESAEIISDFELNITLQNVDVDFAYCLSLPTTGIINRKACEEDFETGVSVGSGPWILDNIVSGDSATFVRNENYWGEVPVTKKLVCKYIAEEAARLMMLENDEVQVALGCNFQSDYPYIEQNPDKFEVFDCITGDPAYVAFNMNDPITGDLNFRKAVASVIDRETYVAVSRNGYGIPCTTGAFWGYEAEYWNDEIPVLPLDYDAAKEYLAASSYNGEEVTITCALPNCISDAQMLQEALKSIGVNAVLNQTDTAGMNSTATYSNNTAQIIVYLYSWPGRASSARSVLYPEAATNRASYNNPEVAELLDQAGATLDEAEREAIYKQVQEIVAEDLPYVCTYYNRTIIGARKGVGGLEMRTNQHHRLANIYMIEE